MDKKIPVVKIKEFGDTDRILSALEKARFHSIEITFRTDCAYEAIKYASKHYPNLEIGAGTVINKEVRSLTAIKRWLDSNGDPMEPPVGVTSVTVVLYKDGSQTGREVTLDGRPDNNGEERAWEATFNSLDNDGIWNMYIEQAYVRDMIRFGDYAWVKRDNGNMSIKWLGAV